MGVGRCLLGTYGPKGRCLMFMGRKNALVAQGQKSHELGPCDPARTGLVRAKLRTSKRSSAGPHGPAAMQGGIEMRRRTFDALATMAGLVLAVVLAIGGGMLLWGHSVISNDVHNQLAAQKIVFPTASSPEIKALPASDATAMKVYAGQMMTTGAQAQTYADHFIAVHLTEIGGGKTYS